MSTQGIALIDLVGLGLVAVLLNLVRLKRLHVAHAALWLIAVTGLVILVSVPPLLASITVAVGATYPASAVSLLAFVFIFAVLIFFSVQLSTITDRQVKLAQAMALREALGQPESQTASPAMDVSAGGGPPSTDVADIARK
jgi:hypothetical protein